MKRREFVTLVGGAAAWPIAARAQRSGAIRRIAVVGGLAPDDVETVARSAAFEQALAALGWKKGNTIAIDYRWIGDNLALEKTAVEVVALAPDVLLASSNIVIAALSKATGTIPIVMCRSSTQSGRAMSRAWRGQAVISPASHNSNTASLVSGSTC